MVDDFPVAFFGNPLFEATVTGVHVEDGDVALFGGYGAKAGVGVAQNQKGIGVDVYKRQSEPVQHLPELHRPRSLPGPPDPPQRFPRHVRRNDKTRRRRSSPVSYTHLLSPQIAIFYNTRELIPLLRVQSLILF